MVVKDFTIVEEEDSFDCHRMSLKIKSVGNHDPCVKKQATVEGYITPNRGCITTRPTYVKSCTYFKGFDL
jgi:hypothetical protein